MTLDTVLAEFFTSAPCSVCEANELPTVGPTFRDAETGGHFCLGCLELACEALPEDLFPELPEDPAIVLMGREIIAKRRTKIQSAKGNTNHARN